MKNYFKRLVTSYPMKVYVTVSRNHNIPIMDVIMRKFCPDIKLLLMYYNHQFLLEQQEYEEIKEEQENMMKEV